MTLPATMMNTLKPIAEATVTTGYIYCNPKSPIIRALEKDGYILGSADQIDPLNPDKILFVATEVGRMTAGVAAPTAPVVTAPATAATPPVTEPATTPAPATAAVRATRGPRVVRPAPTIAHTGKRLAMPVSTGRTGRPPRDEVYPFSKLLPPNEEGQDSFFVHATAELPNPAKLLASTVGSANKRFKDKGHVFKIVGVATDVEHNVAGARIVRVK